MSRVETRSKSMANEAPSAGVASIADSSLHGQELHGFVGSEDDESASFSQQEHLAWAECWHFSVPAEANASGHAAHWHTAGPTRVAKVNQRNSRDRYIVLLSS